MPALDVAAFQKQVQARRLGPVYVLAGEDAKLVERLVDALEGTVDEADRPFAIDRVYAGEDSGTPVNIVASARGLPMLGDRRLVIVLRAERLLKPKRAGKATVEADDADAAVDASDASGGAADTTPLEEYVAAPVPSTTLVFVAADIDRSRRLTKRLLEKAQVIECGGLGGDSPAERREARGAAVEWVRAELVRAGRSIDPDAVQLLVERSGLEIGRLRGDVERLLLYTHGAPKITRADVDEVAAAATVVEDEWAVVNAIGNGDAARALREAAKRFDRGDSPHAMVGQLRWWVSNRLVGSRPDRVKPALDALLAADLALKSSGGDEQALVERLIVELTNAPTRS